MQAWTNRPLLPKPDRAGSSPAKEGKAQFEAASGVVRLPLLGWFRRSPRQSLRILDIGEQSPLAWEPLERVNSAVLKDKARGQRDSPGDLRYQDLALICPGHDARRFMHGDTTNIGADQLHLTDVDANANLQAFLACGSADRGSAAQRLGGPLNVASSRRRWS